MFKMQKNRKNYGLLGNWLRNIIIVFAVAILLIFLPYRNDIYDYYQNTINKNEARRVCEFLAQAVQTHNSLEENKAIDKNFEDIKGKYITGITSIFDPWQAKYMHNSEKRLIYSIGPDGKEGTSDDIIVTY